MYVGMYVGMYVIMYVIMYSMELTEEQTNKAKDDSFCYVQNGHFHQNPYFPAHLHVWKA